MRFPSLRAGAGRSAHDPSDATRPVSLSSVADLTASSSAATGSSSSVSTASLTGTSTTGSWARSTRSAVWMTREGRRTGTTDVAAWATALCGLAATTTMTILASSNLIDVYGDAAAWACAAVPATALGSLVALAGMSRALRLWWQLVFLVMAQWIVGPLVTLNDTAIAHVVPTAETLWRGWQATFGSFKYVIAVVPPTGTGDGALMATWTICLWLSFVAGACALAPDSRRWMTLAGMAAVAMAFVACALLGTSDGFHRTIAGAAAGLVAVVWLSWRWRLAEFGRWLSTALIVLLSAASAIGACLALPAPRLVLRDHYEPPLSPYQYTSPLSGMRAYVKDHKDDTLLTAVNLPESTPVRLAVMDSFDGNVWNLSDSSAASDSSDYRRVGTRIASDAAGDRFTATFTVDKGLSDKWLPLAGAATSIDYTAGEFYYNTDTRSAIVPAGLREGTTYTESGVVTPTPTDERIAKAKASGIDQPEARDVPDSASRLAAAIAGGKSNGGEAAQALSSTLKDSGWFSHGLTGDYPSLPGHGNHRVNDLLSGSAMVGDSEQYASAMALMARELGLPSRVVLGFLPKAEDGSISSARTQRQPDGSTVTRFTGNDVEAWVEIDLSGLGWVAFYPTPKETKVPDQDQDLTPPNPQTLVRQPPVPLTDPLRDETQARGQSSLAGQDADDNPTDLLWGRVGRIAAAVALYGSPVWTVLLACALIVLVKAVALSNMRRRGSPRRRVVAGWRSLEALAAQSGIEVRGTRREQATAIATQLGIDQRILRSLGRDADYAAFSGEDIPTQQAERYWGSVMDARRAMLASLTHLRRLRTRLSLKGVFHWRISPSGGNILTHRPTTKKDHQ